MKKLLFSLTAIVFLSFGTKAQKNDPTNSGNKYDYVGQIHNKELDALFNSGTKQQEFKSDWASYLNGVLTKNEIAKNGFNSVLNDQNVLSKLGNFDINTAEFNNSKIEYWYSKKFISLNIYNYLTDLLKITSKLDSDGDYKAFKVSIIKLENNSSSFSEQDKVFALTTASITRYSYAFWIDYFEKNTPSQSYAKGGPTWSGAGAADVAGAVAGGVRTAVLCAFTGPVGWGAWAGAVIGTGLGASAGYAVASYFF